MMIGEAIRQYEEEIVEQLRRLIRIRSVSSDPAPGQPFGRGVDEALRYMLDLGSSMGFKVRNVDGYAGHVEYGDGDELAAIVVHLDTVPEGEGWSSPPFAADVRDGIIYGRGASDNKGPAVVALYALKALKDLGIQPDRKLRVIFGTNEETGMTDLDYYFERERIPDYAFTPDAGYPIVNAEKGSYDLRLTSARGEHFGGEPSRAFDIVSFEGGSAPNVVPEQCIVRLKPGEPIERQASLIGQKLESHPYISVGSLEGPILELKALGFSAHGATPNEGVNAISRMIAFLADLLGEFPESESLLRFLNEAIGFETTGESLGVACQHPVHGQLTVNLAQIAINDKTLEAVINIRYPVVARGEDVLSDISKKAGLYQVGVEVIKHLPSVLVDPGDPLIAKLGRAYEAVTGEPARLLSISGGTYAKKLRNRGVAFGAGVGGRAHQSDEFAPIADLMDHGVICLQAIYELSL
ncbi:M20 family peptidase [Cohnella endophytica]|uniref:M20 family peptidase n=1 Tax=Cohnella endophytica TaxID=2419778 RepID=A0A494YDD3_9BACL|nr:Sapep family Mn(2+)-dependent dipeptidase [Cohnella endophytica]RKP58291.1 M20 family peptidase [Cohnella endophytica]